MSGSTDRAGGDGAWRGTSVTGQEEKDTQHNSRASALRGTLSRTQREGGGWIKPSEADPWGSGGTAGSGHHPPRPPLCKVGWRRLFRSGGAAEWAGDGTAGSGHQQCRGDAAALLVPPLTMPWGCGGTAGSGHHPPRPPLCKVGWRRLLRSGGAVEWASGGIAGSGHRPPSLLDICLTAFNPHQKPRSDICFRRQIRTICCPPARHMSGFCKVGWRRLFLSWFVGRRVRWRCGGASARHVAYIASGILRGLLGGGPSGV